MSTPSRKTVLLATDQQQSVLNALNANQPHRIAYTPYGHRSRENGLLSLLGFNGEQPDPLTGHYHLGNGYRQYNPVLMRFNCPDSFSPFGKGGLNAYAYCAADPVNRKDPSGHNHVPAIMFDGIFVNLYKNMRSRSFRKNQFSNAAKETEALFGGADKVKTLASANNTPAEAIIARAMPRQKKFTPLSEFTPSENPTVYLHKADSHLSELLRNRNINHELLHSENYFKHLDDTMIRNLKTDQITTTNELKRATKHLLTLRIEGVTRYPDFHAKDWVKVASKIRDA